MLFFTHSYLILHVHGQIITNVTILPSMRACMQMSGRATPSYDDDDGGEGL
jgi:hypothetical protein